MVDKPKWVEIALACADVCMALDQRTREKKQDDLSQTLYKAVGQLTG